MAAWMAVAPNGPMPGDGQQPAGGVVGIDDITDLRAYGPDPLFELEGVCEEFAKHRPSAFSKVVLRVVESGEDVDLEDARIRPECNTMLEARITSGRSGWCGP